MDDTSYERDLDVNLLIFLAAANSQSKYLRSLAVTKNNTHKFHFELCVNHKFI